MGCSARRTGWGGHFGGGRTASSTVLAATTWVGGLTRVCATRGWKLTASALRRHTSASVRGWGRSVRGGGGGLLGGRRLPPALRRGVILGLHREATHETVDSR